MTHPDISAPTARPGSTLTLGVAAAGVVVTALITLAVGLHVAVLESADVTAVTAVHEWMVRRPLAVTAAVVVTTLGSPVAINIVTVVVAVAAWFAHRRPLAVGVIVARVGELLTETALKALIDRPRPHLEPPLATATSSSYPSGHSAGTAAVIGFLIIVLLVDPARAGTWRTVLVGLLALFVLAVPVSRVALGVHHPSDVLGGLALGLSWATVVLAALIRWPWDRSRRRGS